MPKQRVYPKMDDREIDWLLLLVASSDTLSFSGALREVIHTHPDFRRFEERRVSDPVYKKKTNVLIERGRKIKAANKRR